MSHEDCVALVSPISEHEIDKALNSIHSSKAPGIDGFNSLSYNKVWSIEKYDIYKAAQMFFHDCKMFKGINSTTVTLIPNVPNPSYVKQFRPTSCANVLYKIIAKVLSSRLQKVSPKVVSLAQSGFVSGR